MRKSRLLLQMTVRGNCVSPTENRLSLVFYYRAAHPVFYIAIHNKWCISNLTLRMAFGESGSARAHVSVSVMLPIITSLN